MSYTICSRFKGEHIVYAGYTICTSREHIVYGAFCGSTMLLSMTDIVMERDFISSPSTNLKRDLKWMVCVGLGVNRFEVHR